MIDPTSAAPLHAHEIVARLLDPPTHLPVLDLGAGRGNFTAYLTSQGYRAVAFDIDPLDYGSAALCDAPFVQVNLDEALPVEAESVAGCIAIELLEHLEAPLAALRRMAAVTSPGGFVILTTPNIMSWGSRVELLVRGHHELFGPYEYESNGHISPVPLVQLLRMGDRLALTPECVTYNIGRLPLPRLHQVALTASCFRVAALGESLIIKFRKTGSVLADYVRG